jgi:thioredoxin reductase (NADPH)
VTWVVPLVLLGLAIGVMALFTTLAARKRHRQGERPATQVGPRVLLHDINDDRCTGCDACVAVCPTNVLDLVSNKSRVLRFHDCIQCEACMWACPTEALVMFPEGTAPPPLKIPEMDDHFQTAVPGQYLIGEVAGKPLVKSAANLGRMVVEHALSTGLKPGRRTGGGEVDIVIVGSGPGGLSAALTCMQRGLSYVVLEKEQLIASTIARYPKGKLVMAEPYDTQNLSLLPVFDSSKEQLIPIWRELIDRLGLQVKLGESVEAVTPKGLGAFEVKTTVAQYRAQRVVLAIGTRGKPRTLGVPGENLPKVFNLLEDPDDWRGRAVCVVGGGDSAVEAALALADAGAKVLVSYRGKAFNRCQQKNKQAIEAYAAQGRIKAKLLSQVVSFDDGSVILQMPDGGHKKYANDGAFVLIGADPPIAWLEKLSVRFVDRPHQYQLGKTDDLVRRFLPHAGECPEDAARAAAQILGGTTDVDRAIAAVGLPPPQVSGPRKWLRAATNLLSGGGTNAGQKTAASKDKDARDKRGGGGGAALPRERGKLDRPVPLSEFAARQRTHTGAGRRDQLSPGERTRVLRMLRDEGGRIADEESQVFIGVPPAMPDHDSAFDFDLDDSPAMAPTATAQRKAARPPEPDAKQAVIVGLAQAMAKGPANKRTKRQSDPPPAPVPPPASQPPVSRSKPPLASPMPPSRTKRATGVQNVHDGPPKPSRPVPPPFSEEPTRQVNDDLMAALRASVSSPFDEEEATHHRDPQGDPTRMAGAAPPGPFDVDDDDLPYQQMKLPSTPPSRPPGPGSRPPGATSRRAPNAVTGRIELGGVEEPEEMTQLSSSAGLQNLDAMIASERASRGEPADLPGTRRGPPRGPPREPPGMPPPRDGETTRAIDLRKDPRTDPRGDGSLSDVDWDLE